MTAVALVADLMDRSRFTGAELVAEPAALAGRVAEADCHVVIVDLTLDGALVAVTRVRDSGSSATVVGYAPHVRDDLLEAGRAAGCDETVPRSVLFHRLGDLLSDGR